jgi:myo-inositol-1(or 4)-monophosphatase
MLDLKKAENLVKETVLEAGEFLKEQQSKVKILKQKKLGDILTDIDLKSQELIVSRISKNFPNHGFFAEENKLKNIKEYTWTIDPLDGTKYYIKGLTNYSVAISLFHGDDPILGAIYQPISDQLYIGNYKTGTYCNNNLVHVSETANLCQATIYATLPNKGMEKTQFTHTYLKLKDLFEQSYRVRYLGEAVSLAWVSHGAFDAFVNIPGDEYIWDVGPGFALIKSSGGKVTDIQGNPIKNFDLSKGIIASNGLIHNQLIKVLNS